MRLWLGENETATDVSHTSHAVALYAIPYFFPYFIMILLISLSLGWIEMHFFSIPYRMTVHIAMFGFFISFLFSYGKNFSCMCWLPFVSLFAFTPQSAFFSHQNNSIDCWYRPIYTIFKRVSLSLNEKKNKLFYFGYKNRVICLLIAMQTIRNLDFVWVWRIVRINLLIFVHTKIVNLKLQRNQSIRLILCTKAYIETDWVREFIVIFSKILRKHDMSQAIQAPNLQLVECFCANAYSGFVFWYHSVPIWLLKFSVESFSSKISS